VQIVTFPQSGVMRCPGALDRLDAAVPDGAALVGGLDPDPP
jgi:cytosine deaminase